MHVEHFEKGVRYNDKELLILVKKIGKLATWCRFLKNEGSSIRVEASRSDTKKDRDQVMTMITIRLPKTILRAESLKFTPLEGVDACIRKLKGQIQRYKEEHSSKDRAHRAKRKGE